MRLFDIDIEERRDVVKRVDAKYKPVFDKFAPAILFCTERNSS